MSEVQQKKGGIMSVIRPFAFGGIGGCAATCVIQPFDTIKVRIQIVNEELGMHTTGEASTRQANFRSVSSEMMKKGGFKSFYKGLDSAMLRQITYATIRFGLYRYLYDYYRAKNEGKNLSTTAKAVLSLVSGWIGSVFGNPADVSLVRFQTDSLMPKDQRRNYKNVFDALFRIVKEEGLLTLWRGCLPTIVRAGAMNMGMLTTYDEIKEQIEKYTGTPNSLPTRIGASVCSGVVCAFLSLPPDNVKTKLMRMKVNPETGLLPYKGIIDCTMKTVGREGITGLWVGYPTYCMRVCPHAAVSLLVIDFLHSVWK